MREKNQEVLPIDLEVCIPKGDFVFKAAEICESSDYTELYNTYLRAWRKVNPIADAGYESSEKQPHEKRENWFGFVPIERILNHFSAELYNPQKRGFYRSSFRHTHFCLLSRLFSFIFAFFFNV